ncbi:hypothetical protein PanWU01x14_320040 [Parasponia andersonii]|uniref:Uncharacterized protein n=1 Tax=Parasponia andersonii TaxID=3476 RepID=A0A2P5ALR2_PARAD|nr:hypothetical protein PanWU01x14_320040 [Parasponia andersonii]
MKTLLLCCPKIDVFEGYRWLWLGAVIGPYHSENIEDVDANVELQPLDVRVRELAKKLEAFSCGNLESSQDSSHVPIPQQSSKDSFVQEYLRTLKTADE